MGSAVQGSVVTINRQSFFLTSIVVVFFVSALISLAQLRESINILEARYGTSVWSMFQLRIEMRRYHDALMFFSGEPADLESLQERYEILWSRFPALIEGRDGDLLTEVENVKAFLNSAFDNVKNHEPVVYGDLRANAAQAELLRRSLEPYLYEIEHLALANFHQNNQAFNRGDEEIANLLQKLVFLMLGLIVSGSLLLRMVLKESRRNRHQALHDSLTLMPNRAYLRRELTSYCDRKKPFAMHMLDLNGFKDVNDSLGHHTGDMLLKAVSERLVEQVDHQHNCLTCRLGGDEFAIIQYRARSQADMQPVIKQIIDTLDDEFSVGGHICYIGASIGSVLFPEHGTDAGQLLSRADMAMYRAKDAGPASAFCIYKTQMDQWLKRRQRLTHDLREAIAIDQLHIEYQPIVSLEDGSVRSLEALLRWNHPHLGAVAPPDIIDVAEQYGLGNELGCWIIERVCRQYKAWLTEFAELPPVSINISPSMYRLDLVDIICQLIKQYGLSKGSIWIEVTEDTTMKVIKEAEAVLTELKQHDVSIALDDFGTGLSSLSHLQELNLQALKIDRSFVKDIVSCTTSAALVKNIIGIGHDLGMRVVAEGIEDQQSAALLHSYGCDYGQGYLFSRPLLPELIPGYCKEFGLHPSILTISG